MSNYVEERNLQCIKGLAKYLDKLPPFCYDFFIAIENDTSSLTRLNYAQDLSIFFDYLGKYILNKQPVDISFADLNKITARDIERFLSHITYYENNSKIYTNKERGKSRKLATIRSFFKYNFKNDNITTNITEKVNTPKIHAKPINEAESPDHMTKMQQAFNKHTRSRDVAMLSLFLGTGIRVSECVGINIKDVDFEQNAFTITRKGGNQVVLYFSDEIKQTLLEWIKDREILLKNKNEDALFISLQKTRLSIRAVENIVKKYSKIASPLKKISPHKLRSTYGTSLYRETGDIYVVAEVLGHKDVNTTKRHYAAMSEDIKRAVANKVKLRD